MFLSFMIWRTCFIYLFCSFESTFYANFCDYHDHFCIQFFDYVCVCNFEAASVVEVAIVPASEPITMKEAMIFGTFLLTI